MKDLILVRGLPGAGKTTIAEMFIGETYGIEVCTDYWFEKNNGGEFDPSLLDKAHSWTEEVVEYSMQQTLDPIVVHNTFTQPWEWEEYKHLAEEFNYRVHHLICEKRHNGESTSDVPKKKVDKMEARFQVRLQ